MTEAEEDTRFRLKINENKQVVVSHEVVPYLKDLCQLHFLVVKDGVDTVNSLLGLVWRSPLGFLMQDGNQSPDGHIKTDIRKTYTIIKSRSEPLTRGRRSLPSLCSTLLIFDLETVQ